MPRSKTDRAWRSVLAGTKRLVSRMPLIPRHNLSYVAGLSELGEWLSQEKAESLPYFRDKPALFANLHSTLLAPDPIDYLEFGVYRGATMEMWCGLSSHPKSRFFGFDSFEGLPEEWRMPTGVLGKGTYTTEGVLPSTADPRVSFLKGWFQDSLPEFVAGFTPQNRLVAHLDADLYTSTLFVLVTLDKLLQPGSLIVMDDFSTVTDVFRAFRDYQRTFQRRSRLIAGGGMYYDQAAVLVL